MTNLQTTIKDAETGKELPIRIEVSEQGIFIGAEGYGEQSANAKFATPIMVEYNQGELRVIVWANINKEDPTSIINMMGARESNRKKDE